MLKRSPFFNADRPSCPLCDYGFTLICALGVFWGLTAVGVPWAVVLIVAHGQTVLWYMRRNR